MENRRAVISHYDALLAHGDDPVRDPEPLKAYMDAWDGPAFLEAMSLSKEKRVLEIGVGTGRVAVRTAPRCGQFTGIDLSPKTVERARENLAETDGVTLICGDFLTYVFSEMYDVIYSTLTFLHIREKQAAIQKVAGLLKPGGRFVLSIDKNQDSLIDAGISRVRVYPDHPGDLRIFLRAAGMKLQKQWETEKAFLFLAFREAPGGGE